MVEPEDKTKSQGIFTDRTMGNTKANYGQQPPSNLPAGANRPSKFNLQESRIWKDSIGLIQKMWDSYLKLLASYFHRMSRDEQEELLTKYSWIIAVGGTLLAWCQVYSLFHPVVRVIAFPVTLGVAYWFGKRVVSRIVIERLNKYLNE